MFPTVPQGHKHGVTTEQPLENPIQTPQAPLVGEPRRANFLGEPRGGLCPSNGDPPDLYKTFGCSMESNVDAAVTGLGLLRNSGGQV